MSIAASGIDALPEAFFLVVVAFFVAADFVVVAGFFVFDVCAVAIPGSTSAIESSVRAVRVNKFEFIAVSTFHWIKGEYNAILSLKNPLRNAINIGSCDLHVLFQFFINKGRIAVKPVIV